MDRFTRDNLPAIRADIVRVLAQVTDKHGVQFKLGNIRFDTKTFAATLTATLAGDAADAERVAFERDTAYGAPALKRAGYGAVFNYMAVNYTIAGFRPRRKNPVLARAEHNGKLYQLPYRVIEAAFPTPELTGDLTEAQRAAAARIGKAMAAGDLTEVAPPARTTVKP